MNADERAGKNQYEAPPDLRVERGLFRRKCSASGVQWLHFEAHPPRIERHAAGDVPGVVDGLEVPPDEVLLGTGIARVGPVRSIPP